VYACRDLVGERFFVTYGDGLADVVLPEVMAFHARHGGLATMTCVPLYSQYGVVDIETDGKVARIREKPIMREHWMNAGYFVFDRAVFDHWQGNDLEREVLPALVAEGHAYAYKHNGFWKSMDSFKDQQEFDELIEGGVIPWVRTPTEADAARRGGASA
jgi:glucose-1-phosphate cytidylyltransferase